MGKYIQQFFIVILAGLFFGGCSNEPENKKASISGQFTIADSAKKSKDLSGLKITIIQQDSANADADTLFEASADSTGSLSGTVYFREKRRYPMIVSRRNQNLGRTGIILADGDSVNIEGTLPNIGETLSISSREHDAMESFNRINRNFERIRKFASAGLLKGDSLRQEVMKWSDIYWEVFENHEGTIASDLAARESIELLQGLDNEKMMTRIRSIQDQDKFSDVGASLGKNYIAKNNGLAPAIAYLDTLSNITTDEDKEIQISMERIKLLYDSARVEAAKKNLELFKERFPDSETSREWVEGMSYDLNYLSPGDSIPEFQFSQNGDTISRDSLLGTPYILEITRLSNNLYQNQFDRTVVIHSIYKNYDLEVVTLPLDESQITVDAFFEERLKPWPVADAQTFDRQQLIDRFNIKLIPTRFLVDREGKIVRKYVGKEYQDIINGIQTIINKEKEPAS